MIKKDTQYSQGILKPVARFDIRNEERAKSNEQKRLAQMANAT